MKIKIPYEETKFGFNWGSAKIERTASLDDGSVIITVESPRTLMYIRITKSGMIRMDEHKKEKKS